MRIKRERNEDAEGRNVDEYWARPLGVTLDDKVLHDRGSDQGGSHEKEGAEEQDRVMKAVLVGVAEDKGTRNGEYDR